ncbi:hypothetical protein F5Y06DRAFT_234494 [Hypoxylon sp. FL0890]|nr:hypothetical protein F5Y06DRAFT_234494 [Hypoxylon sp. FL0890]
MDVVDTCSEDKLGHQPGLASHRNVLKRVNAISTDLEGPKTSTDEGDTSTAGVRHRPFNVHTRHSHCCLSRSLGDRTRKKGALI